jgi:hypothetical protein
MKARKLLVVAGCIGLAAGAVAVGAKVARAQAPTEERAATAEVAREGASETIGAQSTDRPSEPLLDQDGRPAPGNVMQKGPPTPPPTPDAGTK